MAHPHDEVRSKKQVKFHPEPRDHDEDNDNQGYGAIGHRNEAAPAYRMFDLKKFVFISMGMPGTSVLPKRFEKGISKSLLC